MRSVVCLTLLLSLAACGPKGERAAAAGGFSAELGIDTTALQKTESGLRYVDVAKGEGEEASPGRPPPCTTGWLPSGKKFDSSRQIETSRSRSLRAQQVIADGAGVADAGRRAPKLVIPAELGYGASVAPPDIPPNSILVFDVELLDVK